MLLRLNLPDAELIRFAQGFAEGYLEDSENVVRGRCSDLTDKKNI